MIKQIIIIACLLVVVTLSGCVGNSLNSNPPEYVKSVVVTKEGPGVQVYYILADKNGVMTTADGAFVLELTQDGSTLWISKSMNVTKSDFEQRTVGMGNFAHDVIMHFIGRLAYSDMRRTPKSGIGEVKLTFTTSDGRILEGKDTIFF